MRVLSLFLVLISLSLLHAQPFDVDKSVGNKRLQLVGKSGQIRVLPANATKGDVFTQLKWAKLEEWNTQNQKVQSINNFASQDATWGAPFQTTVNGNDAWAIKLTATLSVGNGNGNGGNAPTPVPLNITVFLFNRTVTVDNGNSTVTVDVNSIKFNVEIAGWPFQSPNNTLSFGVSLHSGGGKDQTRDQNNPDVQTGGAKPGKAHQIQFGPGSLVSPKTAIVDGVEKSITVTYDGQRNLVWTFPAFNKLVYDPTLGADATTTAGGNGTGNMCQPSLLVLMLAACAYLFRA